MFILPYRESAYLVWSKSLMFEEVCPALLKSFSSDSLFLFSANLMCLYAAVIIPQSLLFAPIIEWSRSQHWLLINFHVLFSFFLKMISSEPWQWWNVLIKGANGISLSVNLVLSLFLHGWLTMLPIVQLAGWISWIRCSVFVRVFICISVCVMPINDGLAS